MSGTQDEREAPEVRDDKAEGQVSERVSYIRLPPPARDHDTRAFLAQRERTGRVIREEARHVRAARGRR